VFENRVLGRISGPKRDEVTMGWRELHNGELNDLYSSPNFIIEPCIDTISINSNQLMHISVFIKTH